MSAGPLTQWLAAAANGDAAARDRLWLAIHDQLRALAGHQLAGEPPGRTLHATALVHEAFLRLFGGDALHFANRRHFFALAAQVMRRIRVDDVRRRSRAKRGKGQRPEPLGKLPAVFDQDPTGVLAIDEALKRLEAEHPRRAEVVALRFFAGMTVDETADALGVATRTVEADWRFAKAWLHRALKDE